MDNGAQTAAKKAKLPTLKKPEVFLLSSEQQKVLSLVTDEKKNVFFTGSAGGYCHDTSPDYRNWQVGSAPRDHSNTSIQTLKVA